MGSHPFLSVLPQLSLLQKLRSASSRLLLSSAQQHQDEKEEVMVVQFCVSLQPGLFTWAHKLASADTEGM